MLSFLLMSFVSNAAFADDSISISTSTSVNLLAHGGESAIGSSEVEIITTCHAGYTLTLSTSVNNNGLYLNGDASTAASGYFAPSNGSTPLSLASNTWGYSLAVLRPGASEYAPPTINDPFSAVPNSSSPVSIKTPESTQSETDIDDRFSIYYGVNASSSNFAGNYTLIDDPNTPGTPGVLVYTAITSPACNSDLTVVFDKNAGSDEVTNLPTASENVFDPLNNTLTLSSKRPERAGYIFKEWNTNPNGSGGSFPAGAVIHIGTGEGELIGNVTLYAIWENGALTYNLIYDANGGTDAPGSQTAISHNATQSFIITNQAPIYYGYALLGWSETNDGSGHGASVDYVSGDTITMASTGPVTTKTLYPVFQQISSCPANKVCYDDNGADVLDGGRGTMSNQDATGSNVTLIPSNYSRSGYGFAGWVTDANATPYGPNATISINDLSSSGLQLYAKWVKSSGDLQTWGNCGTLAENQVVALTDTRDNNVYTVTKLADGNCWTMENLRLDPGLSTISADNTHNPTSTFITESTTDDGSGNPYSLSTNTMCKASTRDCINQIQYNSNSLDRSLAQDESTAANNVAWYSYGVYYNWYTATAGNGVYDTTSSGGPNHNGTVGGDICPRKWRLPSGNSSGDYDKLNIAVNGGKTADDTGLRNYPVNFIWSGDYNNNKRTSGYANGRISSATAKDNATAYRAGFKSNEVTLKNRAFDKWDGFAVRCVYDSSATQYNNLAVTFPQNATSVTFANDVYGTETATPGSPVVSLVQGATYTMTANLAAGNRLSSWIPGANVTLGDQSQNPTTISITDDSTLTFTLVEATPFNVNVTFDEYVATIDIDNDTYPSYHITKDTATDNHDGTYTSTVVLYSVTVYSLASTFETGHRIGSWSTTSNGTLSDPTASSTDYTITGAADLTLTSAGKTGATMLLPGPELNAKMKSLAEGTSMTYEDESSKIKDLRVADALPAGFVPSSGNTVSIPNATYPIYIFFDDTNGAGIMYFYTDAKDIVMNPDSSYAFSNNLGLVNIATLASWKTNSVTNMSNLFSSTGLSNIDALAGWDTSNVTDMSGLFGITNITDIDALVDWDTGDVTDMSDMFSNTRITNINGAANWNTENVTNMYGMFSADWDLTNIDGAANWDTGNVTNMGGMFSMTGITDIDALSNWDTSSVTAIYGMFQESTSLTNIDGAINWDTSNVTSMSITFYRAESLTNIDGAINWDTSNVTSMYEMFYDASSLTNIDGAANWDTSNVTSMHEMFYDASSLTNIDGAINWDTSNVTNMSYMFEYAKSLTNIDGAINWDTSNVTNMSYMFSSANSLADIGGAANWNTSKVVDMRSIFRSIGTNADGSVINDWDIRAVEKDQVVQGTGFDCMFALGHLGPCPSEDYSLNPNHPNFTKRSGTWDQYGTFVPNYFIKNVNITVNFDEHINSVSVNYTTITTSGGSVTLRSGFRYKIEADFKTGYELGSWTTDGNGNISYDRLLDYMTLNPVDDVLLTATSQLIAPEPEDVTTTVNLDSNISKLTFRNDKNDDTLVVENGDAITLKQGTSYDITADVKSGYEITSWAAVGGTLSNNAGMHNNFTPTSDSTLTVTSAVAVATHTVTVNMDPNVSYVIFSNPNWPTRVAIRDGFEADLRDNTEYTVTAFFNDKSYGVSSWSTTVGGTLDSTVINPTTYAVTGNATLSVTSTNSNHDVTVSLGSHVSSVKFYNEQYGSQEVTTDNTVVSLKHGAVYDITAAFEVGYEFASWATDPNGIIANPYINPSTYAAIDDSSLVVASQAIPTYTATVIFDEYVSSIDINSSNYPNQHITKATATDNHDGTYTGTASLRRDEVYTLVSSFEPGYKIDTWTTTQNGILGAATNYTTTYVVVGNTTLTLTSLENINTTTLIPGQELNAKLKTLAEGMDVEYDYVSYKIKAFRMADQLPDDFTPSSANTVSTIDSDVPTYIFFDDLDDENIMYFYTEAGRIYMNEDSSYSFYANVYTTDISAIADWDTRNVVNMSSALSAISAPDISVVANWNTSSVTDMSNMFSASWSLANLNALSGWNTNNVVNMSGAFSNTGLTDISALANWNVDNVTDMSDMFAGSYRLNDFSAITSWNTSGVTDMSGMFAATDITDVDDLSGWNTSSATDMSGMFSNTQSLTDLSGIANWNTGNVTDMSNMFYNTGVTALNSLAGWSTGSVTNISGMFSSNYSLTDISALSSWNTGSIVNMSNLFASSYHISDISAVAGWNTSSVTDMSGAFRAIGNSGVVDITPLTGWNTSSVTNMNNLFHYTYLDDLSPIANWNTGNVTDMSYMFRNTFIADLSVPAGWNISSVTNMSHMFDSTAIVDVNALSVWNTSNVTDMSGMFEDDNYLEDISGIANWNTGNVTNMQSMFAWDWFITNPSAINNWDINSVVATAGASSIDNNNFFMMFAYTQSHPNFTRRAGTWDSNGTFIPSNTVVAPASETSQTTSASSSAAPLSTSSRATQLATPSTAGSEEQSESTEKSDSDSGDTRHNPQGTYQAEEISDNDDNAIGLVLAVATGAAVASGTAFLLLARRGRDDDEEEQK